MTYKQTTIANTVSLIWNHEYPERAFVASITQKQERMDLLPTMLVPWARDCFIKRVNLPKCLYITLRLACENDTSKRFSINISKTGNYVSEELWFIS